MIPSHHKHNPHFHLQLNPTCLEYHCNYEINHIYYSPSCSLIVSFIVPQLVQLECHLHHHDLLLLVHQSNVHQFPVVHSFPWPTRHSHLGRPQSHPRWRRKVLETLSHSRSTNRQTLSTFIRVISSNEKTHDRPTDRIALKNAHLRSSPNRTTPNPLVALVVSTRQWNNAAESLSIPCLVYWLVITRLRTRASEICAWTGKVLPPSTIRPPANNTFLSFFCAHHSIMYMYVYIFHFISAPLSPPVWTDK